MGPGDGVLNLTSFWMTNDPSDQFGMTNTTTAIVQTDQQLEGLLSQEFIDYSTRIVTGGILGTISLFGMVFNIVNITVFWRQGFAAVVTISLFALAVADFGSVFFAFVQSICYNIWISDLVPSINFRHVQLLVAAYPHAMCARIGSLLTGFISFERCLCIILPLRVTSILTRPVAVVIIALIYLSMMATFSIPYFVMTLLPQHQSHLNRTVISLSYLDGDRSMVLESRFFLVISLYQILAFFLVILFTSVLVLKMRQKNKWRQKSVTSEQQETVSARDNKVIQMVIRICVTFIICFTTTVTQFFCLFLFPVYNVLGRYKRMYAFIFSLCLVGEVTCSSINIFFYYTMSSRYSAILAEMMPRLFAKKAEEAQQTKTSS